MIITLSPAKSLDFELYSEQKDIYQKSIEIPFQEETKNLAVVMKNFSSLELQKIMKISPKLGNLNYERFQNLEKNKGEKKPALWAFTGDVYKGFDLENFSSEDIMFAENQIRILSGLFGIITPLTNIQAYRLEMGTKISFESAGRKFHNLYEYWSQKVTEQINSLLKKEKYWLNLSSVEYSKVIDRKQIIGKIIEVEFRVEKKGKFPIIAILAKRQRGRMSNWIIKNKITNPYDCKKYKNDGFTFDEGKSDENTLVFIRPE